MTRVHRPARDFPYFDAPPIGLAHRGGALHPDNVGRENTLEAFVTAVGLGFRYLETDVHATRDGVVVAFHDASLDRVTDGTGAMVAAAKAGKMTQTDTQDPGTTYTALFMEHGERCEPTG